MVGRKQQKGPRKGHGRVPPEKHRCLFNKLRGLALTVRMKIFCVPLPAWNFERALPFFTPPRVPYNGSQSRVACSKRTSPPALLTPSHLCVTHPVRCTPAPPACSHASPGCLQGEVPTPSAPTLPSLLILPSRRPRFPQTLSSAPGADFCIPS